MPFHYQEKLLKDTRIKKYRKRNFKIINLWIRGILKEIKPFYEDDGLAMLFITNNQPHNENLRDENFLLETCKKQGINELEVELWLDTYSKKRDDTEFTFAANVPESFDYEKLIYYGPHYSEGWKINPISYIIWRKNVNKKSQIKKY